MAAALSVAALAMFGLPFDTGEPDSASRTPAQTDANRLTSPAYRNATMSGVPPKFDFVEHWSAPLYARGLARGDFNGDGRDDLAAMGGDLDSSYFPARVYLYLQTPAGTFAPPEIIEVPRIVLGMTVIGLTAADFNEDGKDDLAITTQMEGAGLLTMLSSPAGYRWREDHWNDGLPSYSLPQVADQDGDGHLDVVLSLQDYDRDNFDFQSSQLATWFGDGLGGFSRHSALTTSDYNPGLWLGQLDGAGPLDILAVTYGSTTPPTLYRADGAGGWQSPNMLSQNTDGGYFLFGTSFDVNGDGRQDAVLNLVAQPARLGIHLQLPDGTLSPQRQLLAGGTDSFLDRPVDLDGNGFTDLIQIGYGQASKRFVYLLQDAYGLDYPVTQTVEDPSLGYSPMAVAIGDFNSDGMPDVAISGNEDGIRMWRGRLTPYAGVGGLPGAPSVLSSLADPDAWKGEASVTIAAPADSGGTAITGYAVYSSPGGALDVDAGSPSLVHRMIGLARGVEYSFRARASNAAGKGPPSALAASLSLPAVVPQLQVSPGESSEPDVGDKTMSVFVFLNAPAPPGGVSFTLSTQDGSAHAGSDYEALAPTAFSIPAGEFSVPEQTITIHGDFEVEGNEDFQIVASNVQGADLIAPTTVTLYEDDSDTLKVSLGRIQPVEGDSGKTRYNLPLVLSKPQPTDVVVYLTNGAPSGSEPASAGSDFELPLEQVVLPAGQTAGFVPVDIVGDTVREHPEVFSLFASLEPFPTNSSPPANTLITITDNDPVPTLSLSPMSVQEADDDVVIAHFKAALSAVQPDDAWFGFETVAGTAMPGADYVDTHRSGLVIRAGQTELDIPVTVLGDRLAEGTEQFGGRLVGPYQVEFGTATASGSILDNDAGTGISVSGVTQPEGNGAGSARFIVELAAAQPGPVSFDVRTSNGTAVAGSDYSAVALAGLVIPAGQTRFAVDVPVLGDNVAETDETFGLEITQAVGATPVRAQALARLLNDDLPVISISDASVVEGPPGYYPASRKLHFELRLSAPATAPVTYWLKVGDTGSATPSVDMPYAVYFPLPIDVGRTRQFVDVDVYGDDIAEPTESFELSISAVHGATIGDGVGIGTIIDDDAPPATSTER